MTWNCRVGAFRKKAAQIAPYLPDVLVVPECEDVRDLPELAGAAQPTSRLWFGAAGTTRGVGVFSYTGAEISAAPTIGDPLVFFVPLEVRAADLHFNLAAVWTAVTTDPKRRYRQAHEGLERHRDWMAARPTVLLGDFNNANVPLCAKLWRELVELLEPLGFVSAYHHHRREVYGAETSPTHFHKGEPENPWHIDYCFVPAAWAERIEDVEVGAYEAWSAYSDHVPLRVDLRV